MNVPSEFSEEQRFDNLRILRVSVLLVTACFWFSGCAGVDLIRDSSEISGGYEEATNQQMLLNLARLRNDDPPYFVQLSNITTQNALSGGATFSPSNMNELHNTAQTTVAALSTQGPSTWTLGGMVQGSVAQNPTYTFVPLNGDTLSQLISVPLTPQLFYDFIRQDICIDMVARIMLNSLDVPIKILAGSATFKGFDGQGKMLFSYYNLANIDTEIKDLELEIKGLNTEASDIDFVLSSHFLDISDADQTSINAAKQELNMDVPTILADLATTSEYEAKMKKDNVSADADQLNTDNYQVTKDTVLENDSLKSENALAEKMKISLDRMKIIIDRYLADIDENASDNIRVDFKTRIALLDTAADKADYAASKVAADIRIIPLSSDPSQLLPIQDKDGYYLGDNGERVLDKNGNYCDKYGYLTTKNSKSPISAFNADVQVAVYFPTTYTLQNDPLADSYSDFLTWCDNERVLQEQFLLSVQDSSPQENHKPDTIYTIKDLKLADIVSAQGAGYEVIPADALNAPAAANDASPSSTRYIVKKMSALGSSLKVSTLKVNPEANKQGGDKNIKTVNFSDGLTKLLRLTAQVTDFEKHEPILGQTVATSDSQSFSGNPNLPSAGVATTEFLSLPTSAAAGPDINESPTNEKAPANPSGVVFNIRTFLAALRAVAKEELYFKAKEDSIKVGGRIAKPILTLGVPDTSNGPCYFLSYQNYRGKGYYIADNIRPDRDHHFFDQDNRRVFTVLTLLFADVSLDPTKLQQPIQVIP